VLPFCHWLTQVFREKRPLNGGAILIDSSTGNAVRVMLLSTQAVYEPLLLGSLYIESSHLCVVDDAAADGGGERCPLHVPAQLCWTLV